MSQENEKLKNSTSFTFNGQTMSQEEVAAFIDNANQKVTGVLGDVSGRLKDLVNQAPINVSTNNPPNPEALRRQIQQMIPKVEASNSNGNIKLTVNGQPLVELNLSNLFPRS